MQKSTKTPGPAIRIQVSLKLLRGAFRVELLYAYKYETGLSSQAAAVNAETEETKAREASYQRTCKLAPSHGR